jgi:hypothetical protein
MKLLSLTLLLTLAVSIQARTFIPFIGMYSDDQMILCEADLPVFVTTSVFFVVYLPPEVPSITAAEFRVDHLPGASEALITPNWNTPLVIGDAGYGIALAFNPAIPGPYAFLGTLDFFGLVDLGSDYLMTVMESNDSGLLVVVDDTYSTIDASGGYFTFNCYDQCYCGEIITTVEGTTVSHIKALY